ncbi:MAG: hypothetical protein ACLQM8_23435 [Limisphaerales bacterium]
MIRNRYLPQPLHRFACGAVGTVVALTVGAVGRRRLPPDSWLYTAATVLVWLSIPVGIALACVAHRFSIVEGWAGDAGYEGLDTEQKGKAEHSPGRWLQLPVWAFLSGALLFLFGLWCLMCANMPAPPLALPLPQRLLTGLGFMFCNPFSLVPIALILTASRFLMSKLCRSSSAAVTLAGFAAVLVGVFWVPNPIVLWPFSMMSSARGEPTLTELIGQLFMFHIVPAPRLSYSSDGSLLPLFRWQITECAARFCILIIAWTGCLAAIWTMDRRGRTANRPTNATQAG